MHEKEYFRRGTMDFGPRDSFLIPTLLFVQCNHNLWVFQINLKFTFYSDIMIPDVSYAFLKNIVMAITLYLLFATLVSCVGHVGAVLFELQ